ncbi:MAG: TonB-dependent receptor [Pseudomonadota bacterium]|mgnify:CR=1 FL=1
MRYMHGLLMLVIVLSAGLTSVGQAQGSSSSSSQALPGLNSAPAAEPTPAAAEPASPPTETPATTEAAPEAAAAPSEVPVEGLPPASDEPAQAGEFEEVIVTATRRATSLMKIPMAISEVSGEALENNVIRDTQSLLQVAPSLNIQFSGSEANATIRIRGIGTGGGNAGFESSVGSFVDGVYLPRPGLVLSDLVDIERVEVLRGPQGTLFGKNTTVGAISIHTRAPSFAPEADLRIGVGSFNNRLATVIVGGPLIDDLLAVRLSGQYNQRDGYVLNIFNGESYNDRDRYTLRAQALLTPTDAISLRLIGQRNDKRERCCVAPYTQYNATTADEIRRHGGTVFDPVERYKVAFDYTDTFSNAGEDSYTAILDWDPGESFYGIQAKGLLNHATGFADDKRDGDFNDIDFAYQPYVNAQTQITTGEFTLQGAFGLTEWLNVDWLGGLFYSDETIGAQAQTLLGEDGGSFLLGSPVPPGTQLPLYPEGTGNNVTAYQDGTSASLFTHNVFRLPWGLDATVGLRYLTEEKIGGGEATSDSPSCDVIPLVPGDSMLGVVSGQVATIGGLNATRTSNSLRALCGADPYLTKYEDKRVTGTFALGKNFDFGLYIYASYSQGFKSGGINLNPPSTIGGIFQFRPETIDNYEAGVRFPLFGGALQTRATYFLMDLRDYQVNTFDGTAFSVSNVKQVDASGLEFESDLRIAKGLSFKGNFTYTKAVYGPGVAFTAPSGAPLAVVGKQLTNSPVWVGQLSANFGAPLPHGMAFFSTISARYQSEVNTGVDLDPGKAQEAYTLLNGRMGFRFPGDFEFAVAGANLADQAYRQIIFNAVTRPPASCSGACAMPGSFNGYPGSPRMISLELRKTF